jgi:hypothetical protein
MKLIKLNQPKINEVKHVPGLADAQIEYELKSARGTLNYTGPKFTPEMWHPILSFFRWTHEQHQSECQVRLYVNVKLGRWGAWAFPQAARTGMTAKELPVKESPEQAKVRFAFWQSEPSDDWLYFGTVHHHCSASAFQSSTDEQNEWNQDGLHITSGKMDQERHEVDARFYLDGKGYEADLARFWLIDPMLADQVPATLHHQLALHQMGAKVVIEFPEVWKQNLVEPKPETPLLSPLLERDRESVSLSTFNRMDEALEDIMDSCRALSLRENEWLGELQHMAEDEVQQIIVASCIKYRIHPDQLFQLAEQSLVEM